MATASIHTKKKLITVEKDVETVTLELSKGEATFLWAILRHIGGDEIVSPRKFQRNLTDALNSALGRTHDDFAERNSLSAQWRLNDAIKAQGKDANGGFYGFHFREDHDLVAALENL